MGEKLPSVISGVTMIESKSQRIRTDVAAIPLLACVPSALLYATKKTLLYLATR